MTILEKISQINENTWVSLRFSIGRGKMSRPITTDSVIIAAISPFRRSSLKRTRNLRWWRHIYLRIHPQVPVGDPEYIKSVVENYDVLVGEYADISSMYTPRGFQKTVYQHFSAYDNFLVKKEDIDLVLDTIDALYPDLGESAREYFSGKRFRGYNCFILKRELFFQLCEIEVNVLRAISQTDKVDFTYRSSLEKRTYGFFCEWMYGMFIYHLEKQKRCRIKQLQLVFFEKTENPSYIKPQKDAVAVVYLTNRYFLPMTQTSIQSLIQSKKPDTAYDIVVAHEELTKDETETVAAYFSQYENVTVRFISFAL